MRETRNVTLPVELMIPSSVLDLDVMSDRLRVFLLIVGIASRSPDGWCYLSASQIGNLLGIPRTKAVSYRTLLLRQGFLERFSIPKIGSEYEECVDPDTGDTFMRLVTTGQKPMGYRLANAAR